MGEFKGKNILITGASKGLGSVCAREFMVELLAQLKNAQPFEISDWLKRCQGWKLKYPVVLPEYKVYFLQIL